MTILKNYIDLMRFNRPIGIFLLLWPTWWALWIAGNGAPSLKNIFIFTMGVIVMRAAGCVINDIADRNFDRRVTRTQHRPLASKKIQTRHAYYLFIFLCMIAFVLVLFLNLKTILISFIAVAIAILYPFMKRVTHWPQLILGLAFSCAIPMAFAAENHVFNTTGWLLLLANIAWTIAYDTEYAITDREEDKKIGIKSTALLFEKYDRGMIGFFQIVMLTLLALLGLFNHYSAIYFGGLFFAGLLFCYQQTLLPEKSFTAFLNNQWVGLIIFIAIAATHSDANLPLF